MLLLQIALLGGLFAVLGFIHFFVDWIFQSHAEAMVKHNNPRIRAKHCLIYTVGFVPLFCLCDFSLVEWLVATNILFWSHFCEDTYIPVFLWTKYIRKPPEMASGDPHVGFVAFIQTAMGKILMIAIDQIIHLAFLFPIAWMILQHIPLAN